MEPLGTENFATGERCRLCTEPIYSDEEYVLSPEGWAYHAECAPEGESNGWERVEPEL